MRERLIAIVVSAFVLLPFFPVASAEDQNDPVLVRVQPAEVLVEKRMQSNILNFDFVLENRSDVSWQIARIQLAIFDDDNNLAFQQHIGANGLRPGLEVLGKVMIPPKESITIFNPFHTLNVNVPVHELHYEFTFATEDFEKEKSASVTVKPILYSQKTDLILPVKGRVLVDDGHDFLAHHRRVDLLHPAAVHFGVVKNSVRYSYDFVLIDPSGKAFTGDDSKNENWMGYGVPIYAPGNGRIAEIVNDFPENRENDFTFDPMTAKDFSELRGNYVAIDHLNGEFSLLCHLKKGSIVVKKGEDVKQGQKIGEMGLSGDSTYLVHLHYQLQNGVHFNSEGLPSYFRKFRRIYGKTTVEEKTAAQVDSGDVIESMN